MKLIKRYFKPTVLPFFTLCAGFAAFLLRLWQQTGALDEKGLYRLSHPACWLSLVLAALTAAGLALVLLNVKKNAGYRKRFPRSVPAAVSCWLAAVGVAGFAVFALLRRISTLSVALGVISLPGVLSFVLLGFFRLKGRRPSPLFHGILSVYFMLFSLYHYDVWSGESQLISIWCQALAPITLLLTFYYRAALDRKQKCWRIYTYLGQLSLFLCFPALPAKNGWFYLIMLLWAAANTPSFRKGKAQAAPVKPMRLPQSAQQCITALEQAGFEAYVVGGCVRDHLLGLTPKDYDLCTSAKPEEICRVFADRKLVHSGEKHGTVGVVFEDGVCEITTFRAEGAYTDSRHPDWVAFVSRLEDDLKRRDFTVNAMAYSPSKGLVDPYGGRRDLRAKVLRTVGDPQERFREDALRILRGVRFAARYRMTVEEETLRAMTELAPLMDNLARERVYDELCKYLPLATAENMALFKPVLTRAIPELGNCVDFAQYSPHHRYDVYTHTAHVVEGVSEDLTLRWAALLHDIAKPAVFSLDENGQGHFKGHAPTSAQMAEDILRRLRAPNTLREQAVFLAEQHMTILEPDRQVLLKWVGKHGKDNIRRLLELQQADFHAKGTGETTDYFQKMLELLDSLMEEEPCLTAKDLKINGRDVLALGVDPGPLVGECMRFLLERVQENAVENTREALLAEVETFLHSLCTDPELFNSIIEEDAT